MKSLLFLIFSLSIIQLQADDIIVTQESVIDTRGSLEWQDNSEAEENIWKMAVGYCKQLDIENHHDWRLPTQKELIALSKRGNLKEKFRYLEANVCWSSDSDKDEELNAITVFTGNGFKSSSDKCDKNFIICVRDYQK